jgi:sulfite reductase (NADPH) flavoprotein alpha-component
MAMGNPAGGAPSEANQTRALSGENSARTPNATNRTETGERENATRTASGRENVGRGGENATIAENQTRTGDRQNARQRGENAPIEVVNDAPLRANEGARTNADYLAAAKAFDLFKQEIGNDYSIVTVSIPQRASKVLNVSYYALNPAHSRASNQLQIDVEKGEVVKHTKYDDKTLGEKFISSIFPLHSGDFFGVVGLTLFCVSSLAMALFAITGYMLYFERFARNRRRAKGEKLN